MITLKKISVKAPENDKDLFMMLFSDTQEVGDAAGNWDHFVYRKKYDRMWAGEVDRDRQEFSIRKVGDGVIDNNLSDVRIKGQLKKGIVSKTIELKFVLTLWPLLRSLMVVGVVTNLMIKLFNDVFGLLLIILAVILVVLYFIRDLQISEEAITEYIKKPKSASGLAIVSGQAK